MLSLNRKPLSMKNHRSKFSSTRGFTLIEMMAVTAIIIFIAGMLVVAVSKSLAKGRVTNVAGTVQTINTAVSDYLTKPGSRAIIPLTEGAGVIATSVGGAQPTDIANAATIDLVLMREGCLDKPLSIRMGPSLTSAPAGVALTWDTSTQKFVGTGSAPTVDYSTVTRLECAVPGVGVPAVGAINVAPTFKLDGSNPLPTSCRELYLVIPGVSISDAYLLASTVDGPSMMDGADQDASAASGQSRGPVIYSSAVGGLTDVYFFVTKQ